MLYDSDHITNHLMHSICHAETNLTIISFQGENKKGKNFHPFLLIHLDDCYSHEEMIPSIIESGSKILTSDKSSFFPLAIQ